jgi:hypothetical protein
MIDPQALERFMLASLSTFEDYLFLHSSGKEFNRLQLDKWITIAQEVFGNQALPDSIQAAIDHTRSKIL